MEVNYKNQSLVDLLPRLNKKTSNACLLNSSNNGWSQLLAYNPSEKLSITQNDHLNIAGIYNFIEKNQRKNRLILGYFGYDSGFDLLNINKTKIDPLDLPKVYLLAYDNYAKIENRRIVYYGQKPQLQQMQADKKEGVKFKAQISMSVYENMFSRAIEYIKSGHIYQVNLSHQLKATSKSGSRQIYKKLAEKNKGSMMAYLEGDGFELMSMSPERFVHIENENIFTTPIKGTAEKQSSKSIDAKNNLLSSKKELSELSMITDLLRNDLSKVCLPKSVVLEKRREIHVLTSLIHTYSKISGKLKPEIKPIEALLSMLPGGSITGCPKKRAIEIIDELEPYARGAYCGSFVFITPDNRLDSNILIRTIIKKGDELTLQIGGGIVFDSDKSQEYQETMAKARPVIEALGF